MTFEELMATYNSTTPVQMAVVTNGASYALVLTSAATTSPPLGPTDNVLATTTASAVVAQVQSTHPNLVLNAVTATALGSAPSVTFSSSGGVFMATFPAVLGDREWQIEVSVSVISLAQEIELDPIMIVRKTN